MSSNFTFKTTVSVDEAVLHSALENCVVPAKAAVDTEVTGENPTDQQALEFWKNTVRRIVNDEGGVFIHSMYQGNKLGFGFARVEGSIFHCIGGFYGNINGSRRYAFNAEWWDAMADFVRDEGYEELRYDVFKGGALEGCCKIVSPKLKYTNEFDTEFYPERNKCTLFKIYL